MAAAGGSEELPDPEELSCSFCLQLFTDPVRLSGCGHSFCRGCITAWCRDGLRSTCPLCRASFELRDLLPDRDLVARLSFLPLWLKEELEVEFEPKLAGAFAACDDRSLEVRQPRKKEEIRDNSKQLEVTAETIHRLREDLNKAKEHASHMKSQITKDFCRMKEYVERQERYTLMFIEQEEKAAQQKIEETIHQLSVERTRLTDIKAQMNFPEGQRHKGSPSTMKQLTLDEKLNVVKSAVEDLKRKMEILLLEKYTQQLPPVQPPDLSQETSACSLPPESAANNPEPMISSQFSQWTDDVTFDLTRICERLAVTAQKKKVMVSSQPTNYKPSSNRFCISQVMCSQSFSTGCHYWEVITKDSDGWAVGVAQEMIGKKDKLGRTEHSWCVEWVGPKKQLSAWHGNQETLLHKDKPLKVGIFLDLQNKNVSFYSIADKEMCLHIFKINTSNPLYPAFWLYSLEKNGSLTISHTNRR